MIVSLEEKKLKFAGITMLNQTKATSQYFACQCLQSGVASN